MNYRNIPPRARLKIIRILNQELDKPELTRNQIFAIEDLLSKLKKPYQLPTRPCSELALAGSALSNRSSRKRRTSRRVAILAAKALERERERQLRERSRYRYY
jgi:hypothetical protein